MAHLTNKQIEIRDKWIDDLAHQGHGECPCCNRSFELGKDKAEKIAAENIMAFNALVAALCPDNAQQSVQRTGGESAANLSLFPAEANPPAKVTRQSTRR